MKRLMWSFTLEVQVQRGTEPQEDLPGARNICLTPSWRCVYTTDGLDLTEATCACRLVPPVVRAAQRPVSGRRTGVL
jgi:hypothetical protein